MKILRCILGVLLCAGLTAMARAEDASAAFDSANKLYAQGKFAAAASAYESLVTNGVVSATLQFNLGNAYFKNGQIGNAIAAYRAAEVLTPRDPDLRANLQFALNRVPGPSLKSTWLQRSFGMLSLNEWTLLSALGWWGVFTLLILAQVRPKLRPVLRPATWSLAIVAIVAMTLTGAAVMQRVPGATAIVTLPDVTVRTSPLDEAPSAFTVHDGAELRVLDHKDDWLQVSDGGPRYGWLKRSVVHWAPRS